jgi:hypothetical protein
VSLNPLDLVVDPAFEPRLDRALCARCLFVDRCPAPRRRADPPSLENRSSSRAGRLQVPLPSTLRALLCLASFLGSTCARRVPVCRRHPQAEHATVEPRPCLCLAGSRVSTNPRRAHFPACRHPVYVPLSCACCRHCAIATAVPPKFCPHTPPPGRGPIPPGRTCARALTHTRGRSPAYVPQPTPSGRSSPFSLSLFPCLVHAINFVSLPWPCRRRSARTRTHATEGPSPCFTCP